MRYLIILLLLLFCGCGEEKEVPTPICFEPEYPEITYIIGIDATDRAMVVDYLKDCLTYEDNEYNYLLAITLQDRRRGIEGTYKIKTFEDLPRSPVYFRDNMWFIRYENNKGYMPITRGLAEKEKERENE